MLLTDAYKFSLMCGGFPLRRETFYYSHRHGGWQYLPLDVEKWIHQMLMDHFRSVNPEDFNDIRSWGYALDGAAQHALTLLNQVTVQALPKGSWFYEREPVFSVTGPSALVSWMEPLVIQLQYLIQAATTALLNPERLRTMKFTCHQEKNLVKQLLDEMGVNINLEGQVFPEVHLEHVRTCSAQLVAAVDGQADRLFEVGLRAASCPDQHLLTLEGVKAGGITRTSSVAGAKALGMVPVGTMGHEHIQRYGSDREAFTAMRDRFPGFLFYLPDTFSTLQSGVPAAFQAMKECPERLAGIRFDSDRGAQGHYLYTTAVAREQGLEPFLCMESGWNLQKTQDFERLRKLVEWPAAKQLYGYGGFLNKPPWDTFSRDDVSAVWKICQSGQMPTMKFGDEPNGGKTSVAGRPVLWRLHLGSSETLNLPTGIIAQEGEDPPEGYTCMTGACVVPLRVKFTHPELQGRKASVALSPFTKALQESCYLKNPFKGNNDARH